MSRDHLSKETIRVIVADEPGLGRANGNTPYEYEDPAEGACRFRWAESDKRLIIQPISDGVSS